MPLAFDEIIHTFKQRCQKIFSHVQKKQIGNSDESFFRCYQSFHQTYGNIQSNDVVVNGRPLFFLMEENFLWNFYQKELRPDAKRIGLGLIIILMQIQIILKKLSIFFIIYRIYKYIPVDSKYDFFGTFF